MIQDGLIDEVENILKQGFAKNLRPLQSIGYYETINFIEKKLQDKSKLIEEINISTRQLAKAQKTFFKKVTPRLEIDPTQDKEVFISKVIEQIQP